MSRVSISRRAAQVFWDLSLNRWGGSDAELGRAQEELERAMQPKRSVKAAATRRTAKKTTKSMETKLIRGAVMARAGGLCEVCGSVGSELHHALGRVRVKQAASNCLCLCESCHREITRSGPSPYWLRRQGGVFAHLGEHATARTLGHRANFAETRAELSRRGVAP